MRKLQLLRRALSRKHPCQVFRKCRVMPSMSRWMSCECKPRQPLHSWKRAKARRKELQRDRLLTSCGMMEKFHLQHKISSIWTLINAVTLFLRKGNTRQNLKLALCSYGCASRRSLGTLSRFARVSGKALVASPMSLHHLWVWRPHRRAACSRG